MKKDDRKEKVEVPAELEKEIETKHSAVAKFVGAAICFVIIFIEEIIFSTPPVASMAVFTVYFGMQTTEKLLNWRSFRRKLTLLAFILCAVMFLAFLTGLIAFLIQSKGR